ncbi:MAG: DUF2341 domain-containing protein, partial [Planctomycetota bacterium]
MRQWGGRFLAAVAALAGLPAVHAADFSAWNKTLSITFQGYGKAEALSNFPALVAFNTAITGFDYAQFLSGGNADLRFSDSTRTNELNCEIESWDTNGTSYVWVQVPSLADTNTQIRAFWGKAGQTAPPYTTNGAAWSNGGKAVWHLATSNDSSAGGYNGAVSGGASSAPTNALVGSGWSFDGSDDQIQFTGLTWTPTRYTVSYWIKPDTRINWNQVMGNTWGTFLVHTETGGGLYIGTDVATRFSPSDTGANVYQVGVWCHIAFTFDSGSAAVYKNGRRLCSKTGMNPSAAWTGGFVLNTSMDGVADELRVDEAARSSNWVWAAWMNMASNSTFGTYGAVRGNGEPALMNLAATNVTASSACLNGFLLSTGMAATTVSVYWGANEAGEAAANWGNTNTFAGDSAPGSLSTNLTGLPADAVYYYRYYATNSLGECWGNPAAVFITGDVTIQADDPNASEAGLDPGTATVCRAAWATNVDLTVNYSLGGAAGNGLDYSQLSGAVVIPAGATNVAIALAPLFDYEKEGDETAVLTLLPGAYVVGASSAATVTVADAAHIVWYVKPEGSDGNSGTNWAEAFATIGNAVARAASADIIVATDGTYSVTATIQVTNRIQLRSVNGPAVTTVQRASGNIRIFELSNDVSAAVLSGFTIRDGYVLEDQNGGAGVRMTDGIVTNCIIRNNDARRSTGGGYANRGGGVKMAGGLVTDCRIISNSTSDYWGGRGGGVYMTGGVLRNCVVTNNSSGGASETDGGRSGGGVYVEGAGSVINCAILTNRAHYGGGVCLAGGGLLRNCLVAQSIEGAGVYMTGGLVESATIAGNTRTVGDSHSGLYMSGGAVVNAVVWGNEAGFASVSKSGGSFTYSTAQETIAGAGNLASDPRFLAASAGNYRLGVGSPATDSGINAAWMAAGLDLDGNARLVNGTADRGAYEDDPNSGPLRVYWEGTPPLVGTNSLAVEFRAYPSGSNTTATYYWMFGDGQTQSGLGLVVATNTFGAGLFSVSLAATNTSAEGAGSVRPDYVRVLTTTDTYVSPVGSNTSPFTNWATAARAIQDAVDMAAGRVIVTDGTYNVTARIVVNRGIEVASVNGPAVTTIQRGAGNIRVLELGSSATAALISGFTIRNGSTLLELGDSGGAGILMAAGTVSNCVVRDNAASRNSGILTYGGGIQMSGGRVMNCSIVSNSTPGYWGGQGGGVYVSGGSIEECLVTGNSVGAANEGAGGKSGGGVYLSGGGVVTHCTIFDNNARYGGGAYLTGGTLRNCLVRNSLAGGGVEMTGGTVENGTVVANKAGDRAYSGLSMSGGGVTNTIVYFNEAGFLSVRKTGGSFDFSVSENSVAGTNNFTSDPNFMNPSAGDYRLAAGSDGMDSGTNLPWAASGQDLDGYARLYSNIVDRGAYEADPAHGPLNVNFIGDVRTGTNAATVVYTAYVMGSNTAGLTYYWDFGDGLQVSGPDLVVMTNVYGAGLYSVSLSVTNA